MANLLEKIAHEVAPDLPGLDWAALEQKYGMPAEELVYHVEAGNPENADVGFSAYVQQIIEVHDKLKEALTNYILTFNVQDDPTTSQNEVVIAVESWHAVQKDVLEVGGTVLSALKANVTMLSSQDAVLVDKEQFRAIISSTYLICLYGAVMHAEGTMQLASVAPEDIVESADQIVKTMNGLLQLIALGALDPLRDPTAPPVAPSQAVEEVEEPAQGASGVGAVPVAIAVALFATLAVGIIAWCVVAMAKQAEVNRQMRLICEDAVRRQDPHATSRCVELLKINTVATQGPIVDTALGLGKAALMIGGAYLIIRLAGPVGQLMGLSVAKKKASAA